MKLLNHFETSTMTLLMRFRSRNIVASALYNSCKYLEDARYIFSVHLTLWHCVCLSTAWLENVFIYGGVFGMCVNLPSPPPPLVPYMCVSDLGHHWFRQCFVYATVNKETIILYSSKKSFQPLEYYLRTRQILFCMHNKLVAGLHYIEVPLT